MIIDLTDTTSSKISAELVRARREMGSPATGLALTLIVVTDEKDCDKALEACLEAGKEHPSRILLTVLTSSPENSLTAQLRLGEGVPGELIVLRLSGVTGDHAGSAILPLLLPDSPVVVWWSGVAPLRPAEDSIGALADRRITDAMAAPNPLQALVDRATFRGPGDTDLTWTRLTPWRALLAAALDQVPARVLSATVEAGPDGTTPRASGTRAPAELLAAWLESRLGVDVAVTGAAGPGIIAAHLTTVAGDITITRQDGLTATYVVPDQPHRSVALRRRDINQLLTEELRRLDADDVFDAASEMLLTRIQRNPESR